MGKKWIDPTNSVKFQLVHRPQSELADGLVLRQIPHSLNLERKDKVRPFSLEIDSDSENDSDNSIDSLDSLNSADSTDSGECFPDVGLGFADEHAYDYAKHLRPIDESVGKFIKPTIRMPNVFASEPTVVVQKESQVFDPNVAQVLSALDDEAYIEEDIDGFFDSIGQDTLPDSYVPEPVYNSDDEDWVKEYKKYSASRATSDDDFSDDNDSQRTPRVAKTATTSFSMSSSSIFRNEKLSHLDDCFEKVLHEYSDEEVGELNEDDPEVMGHLSLEMNEMFDQFLSTTLLNNNSTMIIERRAEHLDEIRQILKGDNQRIIDQYKFVDDSPVTGIPMPQVPKRDRWDCETVLTGYTNIYNHPQLIKEISKNAPQIRLKGPKGMPVLNVAKEKPVKKGIQSQPVSRDETPEDKKARKQAIKSEKKERRVQKKETKLTFKSDQAIQMKLAPNHIMQQQTQHIQ